MTDTLEPGALDLGTLDLRGLKCPLPALLARKRLAGAQTGGVLLVIADDPMATVDIPFMCHGEGVEVEKLRRAGRELHFTLRKPGRS